MPWTIGSASVIGSAHVKAQMPCQDYHITSTVNGALVVAVSDGLGSAAKSDHGAHHACRAAVAYIERTIDRQRTRRLSLDVVRDLIWRLTSAPKNPEQMLREAAAEARNALVKLAAAEHATLSDYACTLILAVVMNDSWHAIHVGDGALVGVFADGTYRTLSAPERGEYVNSVTPITSSRFADALRYSEATEQVAGVAVFSDGIQHLCINNKTGAAFEGFFKPIFAWFLGLPRDIDGTSALSKLLDSAQIRQKSDDDLTLVLAVRT